MQPLVVLDSAQVAVQPGAETRLPIKVRNPGTIVEAYRLEVLGASAGWATAEPDVVSVYPGQDAEAEIVFRPPRSANTPLGLLPFGVRAVSDVDPSHSMVAEGELEVGGIVEIDASLLPRNSKGRWRGKHRIEIENNGNSPIRLGLKGTDQDEQLDIRIKPDSVDIPVGDFAVAKVKAKIRSPFLRGPATPRPFRIVVDELPSDEISQRRVDRDEGHTETLDGAVAQRQIIGGGLVALVTLAALAVGGFFAFTALQDDTGTQEEAGQAVPRPPEGLEAVSLGTDQIRLTWTAPTGDEQGFDVLEVVDDQTRTLEGDLPRGDTTFTAIGLDPATQYCFALRSFNAVGRSRPTGQQCATTDEEPPPEIPPAPSGVTVTVSDDGTGERIQLAWTDRTESGAETLISENQTPLVTVPRGRSTIELGRPPGEYCYELTSVVDDVQSPPAVDNGGVSRFCVEILVPEPTVPEGTLGHFIQLGTLVPIPEAIDASAAIQAESTTEVTTTVNGNVETVQVVPAVVDESYTQATDELTNQQRSGHDGAILVNSAHVGIPGEDSWAVIVPGFGSPEAANEYCTRLSVNPCVVREAG